SFMARAKTPYFFLGLPSRPDRRRYSELYAPVEPLFRRAGIEFLNPLEAYLSRYQELKAGRAGRRFLWVNGANAHPGPFSAHFYATYAAEALERRFPAALGRRSRPAKGAELEINDATPPVTVSKLRPGLFKLAYPWGPELL